LNSQFPTRYHILNLQVDFPLSPLSLPTSDKSTGGLNCLRINVYGQIDLPGSRHGINWFTLHFYKI
jgi:hypothetical protein